ncbi:MAG: hypothetical protein ACK5OX_14920 [Desertimonas sp.]
MNAGWYRNLAEALRNERSVLSAEQEHLDALLATASTHVDLVRDEWGGPLPASINDAAANYFASISTGSAAIGAAIDLLGQHASYADQIADAIEPHENVLNAACLVAAEPEAAEAQLAARRHAREQITNLADDWTVYTSTISGLWQPALDELTRVVNAAMFTPDTGVTGPTSAEYLTAMGNLAYTTGLHLSEIDPTGLLQQQADELHAQLIDPEGIAAITAAVIDIGKQANLDKLDGNWSGDDLQALIDDPSRAEDILRQMNEQGGWEMSDADIATLAAGISVNAALLRGDHANDWEDLDDDKTFGDWFKTTLVGPIAGIIAGTACGVVVGVGTYGTGIAYCTMVGGYVTRGVDAAMGGATWQQSLNAAGNPTAMLVDFELGWATYGLVQLAPGWFAIRPAPEVSGSPTVARPSLWTDDITPLRRGYVYESYFDDILPAGFPTIDRFEDGIATSLKTLDLHATTYSSTARLASKVRGYINQVASFSGGSRGPEVITSGMVQGRALTIAVPAGATPAQTATLNSMIEYGATKGVSVEILVVP